MNKFKTFVRFVLEKFGYKIFKTENSLVSQHNFDNLAKGYEVLLNVVKEESLASNPKRYTLLGRLQGTPPTEAFSIVQALSRTKALQGDVCEFGVAQGETTALIANEIHESSKRLHVFDSFEGLSKPTEKDVLIDDVFELGSMEAYEGEMSFPKEWVLGRINSVNFPLDRVVTHEGYVEQTLKNNKNLPESVSMAYVDLAFYEPILVTLEFLDNVLESGGMIIVDDYGFFSSGAQSAVDEWLEKMNVDRPRYNSATPDPCGVGYIVIEKIA